MKKYWFEIIVTIFLVMFIYQGVYGEEYKGEYYEKNGCVYLTGNLTKEEKIKDLEYYKQRMTKREKQINSGLDRKHDIEIERIRAKALENYLIAQSLDYSKVVEGIKQQRHNTSVNIGDITSQSNSSSNASVGDIANTNTSDNTNNNK